MSKIAVITLHYIRNYGSVLQTYATQKKLELMGHKVEIIDYVRPNAEEDAMLKDGLESKHFGKNVLKSVAYVALKKIENIKRNKVCVNFLAQNVSLTRRYKDYDDLKKNPPVADVYCTGSDQTWNSEYNGGVLPAYYLEFAPDGKKRVGYAVSIGMNSIKEDERAEMSNYVHKYSAISVRENRAKELLEELGYKNVEHILDPTLVLNKEEWSDMIAPRMIREKYIIIYRLNPNLEMERFAKELSEKTGCKIVRMSYYLNHLKEQGKMIYTPTVNQFLSLINYADYVITDSFHCTAFSLNFNKEFFIFYPGKYNSRLQSVLELTGTEHRVMNDKKKYEPIDFTKVNDVLERERAKATAFIQRNF